MNFSKPYISGDSLELFLCQDAPWTWLKKPKKGLIQSLRPKVNLPQYCVCVQLVDHVPRLIHIYIILPCTAFFLVIWTLVTDPLKNMLFFSSDYNPFPLKVCIAPVLEQMFFMLHAIICSGCTEVKILILADNSPFSNKCLISVLMRNIQWGREIRIFTFLRYTSFPWKKNTSGKHFPIKDNKERKKYYKKNMGV